MASFVHFKFKSQKEPQRISFDGPFIQVWDLKREIISISRLGDGTDFDLKIYNESTNEEYTDDTDLIHKDSTVLARRLPAAIPGKGRAVRYVSGKPPVNARAQASAASKQAGKVIDMNSAQTEEEKVKAMFSLNNAQWQQKQEEMAHETRVPISGSKNFSKKQNVPEGEPPHGYICYRCGKKGHWIQACPTNDDPNYENKNRIKRTTGIPRSMLKKIDQSEIENLDDVQRQNLMVNADGEYVFAQADEKEWRKHLERVKAANAAQKQAQEGDKELQSRGLECPIDKRLFVDPMKTPCCGKTYCNECIENALIDSDLTCPGCETENVSLEGLEPDVDMKEKIKEYESEKANRKSKSPSVSPKSPKAELSTAGSPRSPAGSKSPAASDADLKSKKRTAEEADDVKSPSLAAPAMKRQKSSEQTTDTPQTEDQKAETPAPTSVPPVLPVDMMPPDMATMMQNMSMPNMNFPMMAMPGMPFMMNPNMMNMPSFPNFNMMSGMNGMNGMNSGMSMPMAMPNMPFPNMNMNMNFNQQQQQHQHRPTHNNNNMYQTPPPPQQQPQNRPNGMQGVPTGPRSMQGGAMAGVPNIPTGPKFSNQQRHVGKEEDNAYMRQPVNPHRHQNRGKRTRPREADYREL